MTDSTSRFLLRLAPMIYGPAALFSLGIGVMIPIVPMLATQLGAGIGLSGLVASMLVVGQLLGNLPGSWIVSRVGERRAMLIGTGAALIGVLGVLFAGGIVLLAVSTLLTGMSTAVFGLGRHAFMTTRVPVPFRARALSLLGGAFRAGVFVGPFAAAGILSVADDVRAPLWLFVAALAAVALLVGFGPDPERIAPLRPVTEGVPVFRGGMRDALRQNVAPLSRVGVSAAALSGVRSARDVILPLWGISLSLDASVIALVVSVSGAIDFALFYLSGQVMDRWGRGWAAIPAMLVMGAGLTVLAFTHDLAAAEGWYWACAMALGVGNGLSSGILMTLGADLAPRGDPAPFLAVWRTLTDTGGASLPLGVAAVAALSLPAACVGVGAVALLGALGFARWIPRYIGRGTSRPGR